MKTLIIINSVVQFMIIAYISYKENRIHIAISRTFWCNIPTSICFMWNDVSVRDYISAKTFFSIPVTNGEKSYRMDDEMFENGIHKEHKNKSDVKKIIESWTWRPYTKN